MEAERIRKVFHRKDELWIRQESGDISIPGMEGSILVQGNQLYGTAEVDSSCQIGGRRLGSKEIIHELENG